MGEDERVVPRFELGLSDSETEVLATNHMTVMLRLFTLNSTKITKQGVFACLHNLAGHLLAGDDGNNRNSKTFPQSRLKSLYQTAIWSTSK